MASPINQPSTTTQVTQTGPTVTTTTVGALGDHTVTTTGSGQAESTAEKVATLSGEEIQNLETQDETAVQFSAEHSFSTFSPSTGGAGPTAQAAQSAGLFALSGRTTRRPSELSSSSGDSFAPRAGSNDSMSAPTGGTEQARSSSPDLGSLHGLEGSERAEGTEGPEGPGGLPESTIPNYDPTDKASIMAFLQNPGVQQKMQTKGGHFVYVDEARSSFIFVRNGDWKTAESIKVTNAKTKENLTKPADLEMCVAKFCVGYETIHSDWTNRVEPTIAERSGTTGGDYNHLMLSMKFKTAVVYGPWNAKESSSGFTPSAWRRGAKVNTGPIWDDVGGLKGINWKTTPTPDFSFLNETPREGTPTSHQSPGPGTPGSGVVIPNVNVNLGGIRVDLGGINVGGTTTNVTTGGGGAGAADATSTKATNTDQEVDTRSTGSGDTVEEPVIKFEDPGPGMDDNAPPPTPPPNISGSRLLTISNQTLKEVLRNVRQHLDVAYDQQGNLVGNLNQNLGQVVRNSENGINIPTVILPQTTAGNTDGAGGGGAGGTGDGTGGAGGTTGRGRIPGDNNGEVTDNRGLLARIREHLNDVYPGTTGSPVLPPLENGETIGSIVKNDVSGNLENTFIAPLKPESVARFAKLVSQDGPQSSDNTFTGPLQSKSIARFAKLASQDGSRSSGGVRGSTGNANSINVISEDGSIHTAERVDVNDDDNNTGHTGGARTDTKSTTTNLSPSPDLDLSGLLGKIRNHLDNAYKDGQPLNQGGGHISKIIKEEEGNQTSAPTQPSIAKIVTALTQSNISYSSPLQQSQLATVLIPQPITTSTSTTSVGTGTGSVSTQDTGVGTTQTSTTDTGTGTESVSTQDTGVGTTQTSTTDTGTGTESVSTQDTGVGTTQTSTTDTGTGTESVSTQDTGVGTTQTSTTDTGTGTESVSTQDTGVGTTQTSTTDTGTGTESVSTQDTGVGTTQTSTTDTGTGTESVSTRSTGTSASPTTASVSTQTPPEPLPTGTRHVATISLVRNAAGRSIIVQQGSRSQSMAVPLSPSQNLGPQLWAAARQVAENLSTILNEATGESSSQSSSAQSSPTSSRGSRSSPQSSPGRGGRRR
ncbi:type III secretion system actin-recruiting effector Tarp [Candidatus Chlamydia corallus]|uniref:type III secretion system actin-recruiting effector Tarp n=1 Tax=Candidatus Chlamydia corallus TaxID=2038470 RepID=UPI00125F3A59|nr:type III secretion system actin-recruiting effector Tarp [Candidatus Chlamydia corallus]